MLSLVHVGHNYWHPIIAMSFSQDNSSEFSPIMPDEVREHLIRDQRLFLHPQSFQILQIPSSITVLLHFSSPHSFSTGFRSEDRDSHGKRSMLCSVTHFCVYFYVCFGLFSWWKIQTQPIIRFLRQSGLDFLSVGIWKNPWCHAFEQDVSGPLAEKQAHNIQQYI